LVPVDVDTMGTPFRRWRDESSADGQEPSAVEPGVVGALLVLDGVVVLAPVVVGAVEVVDVVPVAGARVVVLELDELRVVCELPVSARAAARRVNHSTVNFAGDSPSAVTGTWS
jgi:hypothetical protein